MSGTSPQCTSRTESCVSGWTMRMSAPRAICSPPPKAWPCTAAITGAGTSCHTQATCWASCVTPPGATARSAAPSSPAPSTQLLEHGEVEPSAERGAGAAEDDGAHRRAGRLDALAGVGDGVEHLRVEGVALVRPVEADVGDVVGDVDRDAISHDRHCRPPTLLLGRNGQNWPRHARSSFAGARLPFMRLNLSADELLTTTRSVRKRLDFDRPVEWPIVEECLEIALQAPTGGNRQTWHWVVVGDEEKRRAIGEIYRANFAIYRSLPRPSTTAATRAVTASPRSPTRRSTSPTTCTGRR